MTKHRCCLFCMLASLASLMVIVLLPEPWRWPVAGVALASFGGALYLRHLPTLHLTMLYALMNLVVMRASWWDFLWSPYLVALLAYGVIVLSVEPLRTSARWFRVGKISWQDIGLTAGVVVLSSAALAVWFQFAQPDLEDVVALIPSGHITLTVMAILGFAITNAVLEEFIWDGVAFGALETVFTSAVVVIGLQAVSYGFAHWTGIPRGPLGVAMATAYGGLMLGYLRWRTGGLLLPIVAHFFADLTTALLIVSTNPTMPKLFSG